MSDGFNLKEEIAKGVLIRQTCEKEWDELYDKKKKMEKLEVENLDIYFFVKLQKAIDAAKEAYDAAKEALNEAEEIKEALEARKEFYKDRWWEKDIGKGACSPSAQKALSDYAKAIKMYKKGPRNWESIESVESIDPGMILEFLDIEKDEKRDVELEGEGK